MESLSNTSFPVYKKDQVLSHIQLNDSFNYLDEQTRVTRTGLIATGIIDGLELNFINNTITIKSGVAVTSLGFQMQWDERVFTHFHDIELSKDFLEPQIEEDDSLKNLLKKAEIYQIIKNTTELVEDTFTEAKSPIALVSLLDKVVLLLIEMKVKNEDRCDANTCDENAANLKIDVRPLLITKLQADALKANQNSQAFFQIEGEKICVPRFNIPKTVLTTRADITGAYKRILNGQLISDKLIELHTQTSIFFKDLTNIDSLKNNKINDIINNTKELDYQYLYQWLLDIAQTQHEILSVGRAYNRQFATGNFPFHVMLGEAVNAVMDSAYRTGYYPAPTLAKVEIYNFDKLTRLLKRLIHLLNSFKVKNEDIKITPSAYGNQSFDHKAIPFYYEKPVELNTIWNSKRVPLGYKSKEYSAEDCIINPLLYDLESYNFYRIEGHLGEKYQDVIKAIENIREGNRLPFKVIALNALDIQNKTIEFNNENGDYGDLEVDYDISRRRVASIALNISDWLGSKKAELIANNILTEASLNNLISMVESTTKLFTDDLSEFLDNYDEFNKAFQQIHSIYLFHRACIVISTVNLAAFLIEDLIDHLDQLNDLFLEDPFTVLFNEVKKRYTNAFKKTLFSNFYKQNTGLEPLNGVVRGGTFVLVYVDSSALLRKPKRIIKDSVLRAATEIGLYKKSLNISVEQEKAIDLRITKKNPLSDVELLKVSRDKIAVEKQGEIKKIQEVAYLKMDEVIMQNAPLQFKDAIQDFWISVKDKFDTVGTFEPEQEGLIIADFCLPYICCGDGDAINIVLAEPKAPPVVPTITMDKQEFCINKQEKREVKLSPANIEGAFNMATIIKENNQYFYQSGRGVIEESIFFISKEGEKSNVLNIKMLPARTNPIQLKPTDNKHGFVIVNPIEGEENTILIDDALLFEKTTNTTFENVFESLNVEKNYVIKITSNLKNLCPFESKFPVIVPAIAQEQKFEIDNTEFCWIDTDKHCFVISPFKPELFKTGDLKMGSKLCFIPNQQPIDKTTIFPVSYDGKIINIKVVKANAGFIMRNDIANKTIILQAIDRNALKYQWKWDPEKEFINRVLKEQSTNPILKVPYSIIMEISKIGFNLTTVTNCDEDNKTQTLIFNRELNTFTLEPNPQ
jgi:hypothetical protein